MTAEHPRILFEAWLALASEGGDFLSTVGAFTALDAVVHLQNGVQGDSNTIEMQTRAVRMMFPDLVIELDRVLFLPEHLVVQSVMTGTITGVLPHTASLAGQPMRTFSMLVGRVNEEGRFSELWTYFNAGAAAIFPVAPELVTAPLPASPHRPGTEAQARALFEEWAQHAQSGDLVSALIAIAQPDCMVYATNGAVGNLPLLMEQVAIIERAYPDLAMEVEGVLFAEDRVIIQLVMSATHTGRLGAWEPTGRQVRFTSAIMIGVAESGRASAIWPMFSPGAPLIFPTT